MNVTLTLTEVETDLARTDDDITRLTAIVENLRLFINDTDEDRRQYRVELLTFEALMMRANRLRAKIIEARTALLKLT